MDNYLHYRVGPDGWLYTDRLHRPGVPRFLWHVFQHFSYEVKPEYRGRATCEFQLGHYEVHVDVPINAKQPSCEAWSTSAIGDNMHDALEMAAHRALT
jgi:hypothetical protein